MYEKGNMTEIEKQLLDKFLDTDFSKLNICKANNKKDESTETMVLESILRAYANDDQMYLFATYLRGDELGVAGVCMPISSLADLEDISLDYSALDFDPSNINPDELYEIVMPDNPE
jgi:hypothetical protein